MKFVRIVLALLGAVLIIINIYGEFKGVRSAELVPQSALRFEDDISISYEVALKKIQRKKYESDIDYAKRINYVIQKSIAHIRDWPKQDPDIYLQRIPIYENYFLYMLGKFSGLPQMERYHFVDYKRSLERGIGLCGDHAMILSQILNKQQIENSLMSFREGHVILKVTFNDSSTMLLDPDFGVYFHATDNDFIENNESIKKVYLEHGYPSDEVDSLLRTYREGYKEFESTYAFMRKRYIFEYISYFLKWLLPIILILSSIVTFHRKA